MSSTLPCLPSSIIAHFLRSWGDAPLLLFDLMEVAECVGGRRMEVVVDRRQHGGQSLLQPTLGMCSFCFLFFFSSMCVLFFSLVVSQVALYFFDSGRIFEDQI